jgi:hypothetical protein
MGGAIGQTFATAVGVALSPVPIIAVILMLITPRARTNGPAFIVGWLAGLAVVGAVVLAVAGPVVDTGETGPSAWAGWVKLVLGLLVLLIAVRQFRGRPRSAEDRTAPRWMAAIDRFGAGRSLLLAAALAGANPKNLLLTVAAATTVARTGLPPGRQAAVFAVFAVVGTLGVGTPVALYLLLGKRSVTMLGRLKDWMSAHSAVIMSVLCLVIGAKLLGDALTVLW